MEGVIIIFQSIPVELIIEKLFLPMILPLIMVSIVTIILPHQVVINLPTFLSPFPPPSEILTLPPRKLFYIHVPIVDLRDG